MHFKQCNQAIFDLLFFLVRVPISFHLLLWSSIFLNYLYMTKLSSYWRILVSYSRAIFSFTYFLLFLLCYLLPARNFPSISLSHLIAITIDNSRTGLDTSKNQCSAPAVTALKKLLTVSCLQFIVTKELIKYIRLYNYHRLSYWKHHTRYSGIRRKQEGEMCCSKLSVRI